MSRIEEQSGKRAIGTIARSSYFLLRTALLILSVALIASCSYFKPAPEVVPSEVADASASSSFTPVRVALNIDVLGTSADLRELREMVSSVMQAREMNGVFRIGSDEIENTVILEIDEKMPLGVLADLILAVNESGGRAYLPLESAKARAGKNVLWHPNPLLLIVEAGKKAEFQKSDYYYSVASDQPDKWAVSSDFVNVSDWKDVKSARSIGSSLEISANGNYFFNGPTIYLSGTDIEDVEVVQQSIEESALAMKVATLRSPAPSEGIKIIASELAPASSLLKVFEAVDATQYKWKVVVRRTQNKTKS
jgi:hypothetical protein